jgi:predicted ATPase/DNA-binding XRE family transcriptional regulator
MTEREARFGDILSKRRRAAGLTQEALAERAGISARAIAELERGAVRAPRRDTLEMIADALELDPGERERWRNRRRHLSIRDRTGDSGDPGGSSLPIRATSFIGRERELDQLKDTIRREDVRLLTITGPGGVGKTRLALEVGRALQGSFRHGVVFVELAAVEDPELVISTIAKQLGIRETSRSQIETTLVSRLSRYEAMLVIDNFEHVLDAAPTIASLVACSGKSKFLITSRARLQIHAEFEFVLGALDLPDPETRANRSAIAQSPAVKLFAERANQILPDFHLTPENIDDVLAICRRVEGLPLALELAAARVKLLSPREMVPRLTNRLAFLTGGFRDGPDRHQTMRQAIAWSFELLEPEEQRLLLQLSVFVGGWTLEAAERVAHGDVDVVSLLSSLADNSLIHRIERENGQVRFGMLETIREFAWEQLESLGDLRTARDRHAHYMLESAERAERHHIGPDQDEWISLTDAELFNLRAASDWLLGGGSDPSSALRLAAALSWFWYSRGFVTEGRARIEAALARSPERGVVRMKALAAAGSLAQFQQKSELARAYLSEGYQLANELGDDWYRAWILLQLGRIASFDRDFGPARDLARQSMDVARQVDDPYLTGWVYHLLAVIDHIEGDLEGARRHYEACLEFWREGNNLRGIAAVYGLLGMVAYSDGMIEDARRLLDESLRLIWRLDIEFVKLNALSAVVPLAARSGDHEAAVRLAGYVMELAGEVGAGPVPMADRIMQEGLGLAREALDYEVYRRAIELGAEMDQNDVINDLIQVGFLQQEEIPNSI